jgi:hypothetical protein
VSLGSATLAKCPDGIVVRYTIRTNVKPRAPRLGRASERERVLSTEDAELRGKDSNLDYWSQNPASYH